MKGILAIGLVVFSLASGSIALAGEITGVVTYSDGSPCDGCRVAASITWGGVTDHVLCDRYGHFTLRWSGDNWIDKLYVNGNTVMRDVRPGQNVNIRLSR